MRSLDDISLQPGEFALRLVTNQAINVSRLNALLDCLTWSEGFIPPYELTIIDIGKGSLFARFGLEWRGGPPDADRIEKLEQEIAHLRVDLNGVKADNSYARIAAYTGVATAAIAAIALIHTIVHDARAEQPNLCASVIGDLMDRDYVSRIEIRSPDCSFVIEQRDMPEMQRRAEGVYSTVGIGTGRGTARAFADPNVAGEYLAEDATQAPDHDEDQFETNFDEERFAGPALNDENGRATGYARRASGAMGYPGQIFGTIEAAGDAFVLKPDDDQGVPKRVTLIPRESASIKDGGRYSVRGNIFYVPDGDPVFVATGLRRIDLERR